MALPIDICEAKPWMAGLVAATALLLFIKLSYQETGQRINTKNSEMVLYFSLTPPGEILYLGSYLLLFR